MKNSAIYLTIAVALIMFTACKKTDTVTPAPVKSTFTLNGNVYTETASADSTGTVGTSTRKINIFAVSGTGADRKAVAVLQFVFLGSVKPAAGNYAVISDVTTMTAGQVGIIAQDKVSTTKSGLYSSTNAGTLTVNVNAAGQISVSMPSAITVKGSSFDNTDPKNTVITDVTTTVSGSATEQ